MDGPTIQSTLREHSPAFEQAHPLPTHVRDAVHAMLCCRTAAPGGHKQSCPDGHYTHIWYNSCKHRACPQCAYLQTAHWLEAQQARLLACDHYHAIFTIPHDLNDLWLLNTAFMASLLFHTVRDVLLEMLADPRYLGARPGILLALHTLGQTLVLHPHIHCLISGGGLDGEQGIRGRFPLSLGCAPLADPRAATGRMNPPGVIGAASVAQTLAGIRANRPKPTRTPEIPERPSDGGPNQPQQNRLLNADTPSKSLHTSTQTALQSP